MHHAARTTDIRFHPLKTRSHDFSSINMRVTLWLLNNRLCLVIDSRSSFIGTTFEVPSPKVFLVTNEWPLTSYLIHKNILCGIEFQPINYAWDKSIFKSKRNRKWFFFIDRPQYCPFDGIQINSQCPIFHVEVPGGIGKVLVCTSFGQANSWRWEGAGSKTGGVHGAKILSRFFLLHCSRMVLRPLALVRTWMFVCFVCSLCLLPPPFPMLMSCQKSWHCNSCGKATTRGKVCLLFLCGCAH